MEWFYYEVEKHGPFDFLNCLTRVNEIFEKLVCTQIYADRSRQLSWYLGIRKIFDPKATATRYRTPNAARQL